MVAGGLAGVALPADMKKLDHLKDVISSLEGKLQKFKGSTRYWREKIGDYVRKERKSISDVQSTVTAAEEEENDVSTFLKTPGPMGPRGFVGPPGHRGPRGHLGYPGIQGTSSAVLSWILVECAGERAVILPEGSMRSESRSTWLNSV